jgi:hypothetical protein
MPACISTKILYQIESNAIRHNSHVAPWDSSIFWLPQDQLKIASLGKELISKRQRLVGDASCARVTPAQETASVGLWIRAALHPLDDRRLV